MAFTEERVTQLDEAAITRQACVEWSDFLRAQVAWIPDWHPLHDEWKRQLATLDTRINRRPSAVS